MISLALSKAIIIIAGLPPIIAVRLPNGELGATLRSLCDLLGLSREGQIQRIRRSRSLAQALQETTISTPGGPQQVEVLLNWAIAIWAAGLHVSRLSEAKRAAALVLQREVFAAIERAFADDRAFAEPEDTTTAPPPNQSPASQSVWQDWHILGDRLEARDEELRNQLAVVQYDQHAQALRIAALEANSISSAAHLPQERLAHLYQLATQVRQQQGYLIADTLAGLAAHFQVEDIYFLPEKDWPAVLVWFESLLLS